MNYLAKRIGIIVTLMVTSILSGHSSVEGQAELTAFGVDLAFGRRVVSSGNTDNNINTYAIDGSSSTRYAAVADNNAYLYIDLGSVEKVGKIVIDWEAAYATRYYIQMSLDAVSWTTVADVNKTSQSIDDIVFPSWIETKFVRFQGVTRGTTYGYSFYSLEVYGPQSLALGSTVEVASSYENETLLPKTAIVDNVATSRWASTVNDNQYLIIDLNSVKSFDMIKIRWEVSFARIFKIYQHVSELETAPERSDVGWTYLTGSEVGLGEVDTLKLDTNTSTRYLKVELIQRETAERIKKTGRLPWQSTFSIYSFELFDWSDIVSSKLGNTMEFSKNSPAWVASSNITLNESGLILAPHGYPNSADGVVTNLASISDGDIPGFESYGTYNPAVLYDNQRDMFHMIYRSELPDNFANYFGNKYALGHMSTLSYAYSYDGVNFIRGENNPIAWPTIGDEQGGGLEDPRMVKVENDPNRGGVTTYYITYTMYDNATTREGIITTTDFVTFTKHGRLAPNYGGAYKSGTYIADPEGNAVKIDDPRPGHHGKVYMIYMKDGGYARLGFTSDVLRIEAGDIIDIDSTGLGINDIEAITNGNESCMALTNIYGPDDQDIYLMYGGGRLSNGDLQNQQANVHGWFYALGVLKTTKSNPFELTNFAYDLDEPTMHPTDTNKIDYGLFDKCMFADTMIRHDNKWYFYYGAGDMYVGLATARADFGAGAASISKTGDVVTASTMGLNKAYGQDKSARDVTFETELYGLDGTLLYSKHDDFEVPHFSHLSLGKYSKGIPLSTSLDLTTVGSLPSNYYISYFVKDATTNEVLNNLSSYLVITPTITNRTR